MALLTGVILARSGMPLTAIALYEFLFYLSNLASFFWINGGRNALLAAWGGSSVATRHGLPNGTLGFFLLAGLLAGGGIWLGRFWLMEWAPGGVTDVHFIQMALLTGLTVPASLGETWLLLDKRLPKLLRLSLLTQLATLLAVLLPLTMGGDITDILKSLILLQGARLLWLLHDLRDRSAPESRTRAWKPAKDFSLFSAPFLGHAILGGLMDYVDGALVLHLFPDPDQFALYRYGARELPLSMLLVSGVVTALAPRMKDNPAETMQRLIHHQVRLSHWLFPGACLLALVSPLLFRMVYGDAFSGASTIFNIYLLILPSRILMPQTILYGHGNSLTLMGIGAVEVLLNAILSILLAQSLGVAGIAWATVFAFGIGKILMMAFVKHRYGLLPNHYISVRIFFLYTLLLLLCHAAGSIIDLGS